MSSVCVCLLLFICCFVVLCLRVDWCLLAHVYAVPTEITSSDTSDINNVFLVYVDNDGIDGNDGRATH